VCLGGWILILGTQLRLHGRVEGSVTSGSATQGRGKKGSEVSVKLSRGASDTMGGGKWTLSIGLLSPSDQEKGMQGE